MNIPIIRIHIAAICLPRWRIGDPWGFGGAGYDTGSLIVDHTDWGVPMIHSFILIYTEIIRHKCWIYIGIGYCIVMVISVQTYLPPGLARPWNKSNRNRKLIPFFDVLVFPAYPSAFRSRSRYLVGSQWIVCPSGTKCLIRVCQNSSWYSWECAHLPLYSTHLSTQPLNLNINCYIYLFFYSLLLEMGKLNEQFTTSKCSYRFCQICSQICLCSEQSSLELCSCRLYYKHDYLFILIAYLLIFYLA